MGKPKGTARSWRDRQERDPYVRQARREGWRSRAVYKLLQIDEKERLLKKGMLCVDLGAAPGVGGEETGDLGGGGDPVRTRGAIGRIDVSLDQPHPGLGGVVVDSAENMSKQLGALTGINRGREVGDGNEHLMHQPPW